MLEGERIQYWQDALEVANKALEVATKEFNNTGSDYWKDHVGYSEKAVSVAENALSGIRLQDSDLI